jgi:BA14K-like protein
MLRVRTLAAAALLFAGLALGFVLGRMSVWLMASAPGYDTPAPEASERRGRASMPPAAPDPTTPAATPSPATPRQPAARPDPPAPAVATSAPAAGAAPTDPDAGAALEPPKPDVAPNGRAAAGDPPGSPSASAAETPHAPLIKLINPGPAAPATGLAEPARKAEADASASEADRQGLAACKRRYSSFRHSDGTYQPFGGGARQRCPLLRE